MSLRELLDEEERLSALIAENGERSEALKRALGDLESRCAEIAGIVELLKDNKGEMKHAPVVTITEFRNAAWQLEEARSAWATALYDAAVVRGQLRQLDSEYERFSAELDRVIEQQSQHGRVYDFAGPPES